MTAAPSDRMPPGRGRWTSFLVLAGTGAAVLGLALLPLGGCGFLLVLGAPCPGCGMTRATVALAQGDLVASFVHHPLGLPLAATAIAALALGLAEGWTGRPYLRRAGRRWGNRAAIAFIVLLAATWVVRVIVQPDWASDPIRPGSIAGRLLLDDG